MIIGPTFSRNGYDTGFLYKLHILTTIKVSKWLLRKVRIKEMWED